MDVKRIRVALVLAVLLAAVLGSWLLLPRIVDVLPGQIRGRLPDGLVALVTTPLPTALPRPLRPAETDLLERPPAPTLTLEPTATEEAEIATTVKSGMVTRQGPPSTTVSHPTVQATPTPSPTPTATALPLPNAIRLEGLEVIPQKYNNCGPANLAIVLNYYGWEVEQLEIGEALKPNYDDRNVSPQELVGYVREHSDYEALALFGLDLSSLKALLAAGVPVVVEKGLDLGASHGWMGHYLTLYGYDEREGVFYGLDTFLGPWDSTGREFEYGTLEALWAEFNRATVVIYPADRAEDVALAMGSEALNEESMWLAAAGKAQDALAVDTGDAFAWFDLGASLYHLGVISGDDVLLRQAAAAFDRAREIGLPWRTLWYQFEPYLAYIAVGRFDEVLALTEAVMTTSGGRNIEETYLYRGHALLATGDRLGAERAYERALRLNPGLDAAQESLDALAAQEANSGG